MDLLINYIFFNLLRLFCNYSSYNDSLNFSFSYPFVIPLKATICGDYRRKMDFIGGVFKD